MCSWCWGFQPVWREIQAALPGDISVRYLLGGLAPDTDATMPLETQQRIQQTWCQIQHDIPGTEFNFDFWTDCHPRRATYPACRAVIASRMQDTSSSVKMNAAIQRAYYLQARNPSDLETLVELSTEIGLDTHRFEQDINSPECEKLLHLELEECQKFGVYSFPSLLFFRDNSYTLLEIDYNHSSYILEQIL